jgi:PHD/YefM family antitoxin component YafN of YafNO toxin-antitoxin module
MGYGPRPVVLTTNGKADVVVQDAASYQKLIERLQAYEARTDRMNSDIYRRGKT